MKKIFALTLIFLLTISALCSCSGNTPGEDLSADIKADENKTYYFKKGETNPPTSYTDFQSAAINFSSETLSELLKENDNAVYSPAALYYQLGLLQNAASFETQNRVKAITGENLPLDSLNSSGGYYFGRLESLSNFEKNKYIDINGDVFFNKGTPVSQKFLLANADYYNQGVFRPDFSDKDTVNKIDSYIKEKSSAGFNKELKKDSGLLLLNSAYMSDNWLDGFKKSSEAEFKGKTKTVKTTFFSNTEYYIQNKLCEGIVKDLKNTPSKFVALIPKKGSVKDLVKKLDGTSFTEVLNSISVFKTRDAYIPGFSEKATINFTDIPKFKFLRNKGKYSNLSFDTETSVSDIIQSFEFNITKNGISTDKAVKSGSTKKKPDKILKFDRPFLFAVVDNESYIPVYMGVVSDI